MTKRNYPKNTTVTEYGKDYNDAVVCMGTNGRGKPTAVGFQGRRMKPDFRYYFKDETQRETHVREWLTRIEKDKAEKATRKAERNDYVQPYKVGDILYTSWGYEQTNIDFYEVIETRGKQTVVVREVNRDMPNGETGFMSGQVIARPGDFKEHAEALVRRVRPGGYVSINSCELGTAWDGQPKTCSWYA